MINFFKPVSFLPLPQSAHKHIHAYKKHSGKNRKKSFPLSERIVSQKLRYEAFVVVVYSWNGLIGLLVFFARSLSHTHSHSIYKSAHGFFSLSGLTIHEIASHPSLSLPLLIFFFQNGPDPLHESQPIPLYRVKRKRKIFT